MKTAIIIPTKNHIDVIEKCIRSFHMHHQHIDCWRIFVADTGSSEENLDALKHILDDLIDSSKYELLLYDYYHFGKINNEVVKVVTSTYKECTHLLFCNNDIEFTQDIISPMLNIFNKNPNVIGTLGARLLYPNGIIQHDGIFMKYQYDSEGNSFLNIGHLNFRERPSASNESDKPERVLGNTFALAMTETSLFEKIGGLSEEYLECFEDVEYNLKCIDNNRVNVILSKCFSAIHHESLSRNEDRDGNVKRMQHDYRRLVKFFNREGVT